MNCQYEPNLTPPYWLCACLCKLILETGLQTDPNGHTKRKPTPCYQGRPFGSHAVESLIRAHLDQVLGSRALLTLDHIELHLLAFR